MRTVSKCGAIVQLAPLALEVVCRLALGAAYQSGREEANPLDQAVVSLLGQEVANRLCATVAEDLILTLCDRIAIHIRRSRLGLIILVQAASKI